MIDAIIKTFLRWCLLVIVACAGLWWLLPWKWT